MTTNQYTSHGIPNDQWQLFITSFRTSYRQWNRCWSEAHLGTGHVLATAEPYDIYYVIWIDADWAVLSLYDLVQRMILRILSWRDGLSAEVHWKHTNAISCRVMLLPRVKQMSRCRMWIVSKERMMVLSFTRDHRKNEMKASGKMCHTYGARDVVDV